MVRERDVNVPGTKQTRFKSSVNSVIMVFPHLRRETTSDPSDEFGFGKHIKLSTALVKSEIIKIFINIVLHSSVSPKTHSNLQITLFVLQQKIESNNFRTLNK